MRSKKELNFYIDSYIMNHVNYKRKIDPNTNDEYYEGTYQLHLLDRTTIQEDEIEYVFNRLNDNGILIVGDSPVLYGDFENYRYVRKAMYSNPEEVYDAEKCKQLMSEFKTMKVETEEDRDKYNSLREKLILMNSKLVNFIVAGFNQKGQFNSNLEELTSYGYEGLIMAIDKYAPDKGRFFSYAKKYIQGYVIGGIKYLNGFTSRYFAYKYMEAKKELEKELDITIDCDDEYIDEIARKIYSQDSQPLDTVEQLKTKISLMNILSIDEFEDSVYDDNTLYREVIDSVDNEFLEEEINKVLSKLTNRERKIIVAKYGLIDDCPKNYEETAAIFGCSRQSIYCVEKNALKKVKNSSAYTKKLFEYYYDMDDYNYSPTGIETVKVKQKRK